MPQANLLNAQRGRVYVKILDKNAVDVSDGFSTDSIEHLMGTMMLGILRCATGTSGAEIMEVTT